MSCKQKSCWQKSLFGGVQIESVKTIYHATRPVEVQQFKMTRTLLRTYIQQIKLNFSQYCSELNLTFEFWARLLGHREATIWDLPSPIHKASKKTKAKSNSKVFRSFKFSASELCTELWLDSEVWNWFLPFERLRSRFHSWSSIKPDWQQNTKTPPPKNQKPKQTKIKPIRLLLLLISTSTIVPKVVYFQICQGPSKISLCWQKCSSCSNPLSAKNDRILSNIVLQVKKYGGIYRLGVRVPAGSIVKTTLWTRKQTLQ